MLALLKAATAVAAAAITAALPVSHLNAHPQPRAAFTVPAPVGVGVGASPDRAERITAPLSAPAPSSNPSSPAPTAVAPPAPVARTPAAAGVVAARTANLPAGAGSAHQGLINQDRAAAGLAPLAWSGCLATVAAGQAQAMADAGNIFHGDGVNKDLACGIGSRQSGENVGYWSAGVNDPQLNRMFMDSPGHRENILGPYRYVGTAWVVAPNGFGYIAVEFG